MLTVEENLRIGIACAGVSGRTDSPLKVFPEKIL